MCRGPGRPVRPGTGWSARRTVRPVGLRSAPPRPGRPRSATPPCRPGTATTTGGGDSGPSSVVSATTPSGLATPPTALHSTAVTASRVDLAWTDSAGETGYRVERSPDGTTGWAALGTTAANVTAFSDLTVSP